MANLLSTLSPDMVNSLLSGAMSLAQKASSATGDGGIPFVNPFANMTPRQESAVVAETAKAPSSLSKFKDVAGGIASAVGSIAPGPIGMIAKIAGNVLNDDEWWENYKGTELTTNIPLVATGHTEFNSGETDHFCNPRPCILEFAHGAGYNIVIDGTTLAINGAIIQPDGNMIGTYLMPQVRKVVNSVALRDTGEYTWSFVHSVRLYALWQNLKKFDYLSRSVKPYMPDMFDGSFPILAPQNKAWLSAAIQACEAKLRGSVRLPHTTCQYLAWRFGRIYKSNTSAKSAAVLYNVRPMDSSMSDWQQYLTESLEPVTKYTQALADLYNAFSSHDQSVVVKDETQWQYDCKEFCLRTNLNAYTNEAEPDDVIRVIMDSDLTNRTTFMASTVSTRVKNTASSATPGRTWSCLFPVNEAYIRGYLPGDDLNYANRIYDSQSQGEVPTGMPRRWAYTLVNDNAHLSTPEAAIAKMMLIKAVDYYNAGWKYTWSLASDYYVWDITDMSIDTGAVPSMVLENEQVYAFANLTCDKTRYESAGEKKQEAAQVIVDAAAKLPPPPAVAGK